MNVFLLAAVLVDAVGQSNGIPHRIPPPDEEERSLSSIDEDEMDMLNDIEQEKDIFRTKVTAQNYCLKFCRTIILYY